MIPGDESGTKRPARDVPRVSASRSPFSICGLTSKFDLKIYRMYSLGQHHSTWRCVYVNREIMVSAPGHRVRRRSLPYSTAGHLPHPHVGARTCGGRPGTPARATSTGTAATTDDCRTLGGALDRG